MWQITTQDLLHLKGGGGERFAGFVDRLIRAEAALSGLPQSEIRTQLRTNVTDGGVDTEVRGSIPNDKSGWFSVPTCWQFKALDAKDVDDKDKSKNKKKKTNDLQDEIRKPYAKTLISNGYGYRLCLVGDLAPTKVDDWENILKQEADAINPNAPAPRVIHGGALRPWVERFPAIVAWLRRSEHVVLYWEAWTANRRAVTPQYVPNRAWDAVRAAIVEHAQFDHPCRDGDPCLPVRGAAGVGKTRLVFEALNTLEQAPAVVAIAEDEQEAKRVAVYLANASDHAAVLVADDCTAQTRLFLSQALKAHRHRVRVICIDNAAAIAATVAPAIWLSSDALTNTGEILEKNFPHVPEDRRRTYLQLSRNFVRLAADMCDRDAQLASGDLSGLLSSVEEYVRTRLQDLGDDVLPIVSMIALFHKVGFRDDMAEELKALCPLTQYPSQRFLDVLRQVKEAPGFVVQAGRYWYVTPEIVARVLFADGWKRWVEHRLEDFVQAIPSHLTQQLLERVATHGGEMVKKRVGSFFREWISRLEASDLLDPDVAHLVAALVEATPSEYLPQLRAVIENAKPGELRAITGDAIEAGWGPRRTLVWLLERLVSFPDFFEDCEACLFRLAVEESEPQIGNNATAIWANLFSVYLSGTATPFDQRMPILRVRTASANVEEARVAFVGLARALQQSAGKVVGEPIVAGRLRPDDWQPDRTVGAERNCYRAALEIFRQHLGAEDHGEHHRLAFEVVVQNLAFLLRCGLAADLRRVITPRNVTPAEARRLLQVVDDFQQFAEFTGRAATNEQAKAYVKEVQDWGDLFRATDFAGQLREICARAPWSSLWAKDSSEQTRELNDLATAIVQRPELLSPELDWLGSPEAQSAEPLGFSIGQLDKVGDCGRMIFAHAIDHKTAAVLRGYIRGMTHGDRPPDNQFLGLMRRLEATHPEMAVDVLIQAGDRFDALNHILQLVDSGAISARYLAALAMGLGRRELTADEVGRVLPRFTKAIDSGDGSTIVWGVRFLSLYLLHEGRHSSQTCLASLTIRSLAWQLVENAAPILTGHMGYEWAGTVKELSEYDPERAAMLFGQALLDGNIYLREEPERRLIELAKRHPESVMKGFGSALLDPQRGWRLQIPVYRGLIGQLPFGVVLAWIREHGIEAARAIARHLPPPQADQTGNPVVPEISDIVLREFDDDKVFNGFSAGARSGEVWWGNGGERFRNDAAFAKKLLTHPNVRIREYARNEMAYRSELAEREDQTHEERFLPL